MGGLGWGAMEGVMERREREERRPERGRGSGAGREGEKPPVGVLGSTFVHSTRTSCWRLGTTMQEK